MNHIFLVSPLLSLSSDIEGAGHYIGIKSNFENNLAENKKNSLDFINQQYNLFVNFGATEGGLYFLHDYFAYFEASIDKLISSLSQIYLNRQYKNLLSKELNKKEQEYLDYLEKNESKKAARQYLSNLPREDFIFSARQQEDEYIKNSTQAPSDKYKHFLKKYNTY